jgi:hypothetical protein
MFHKILWNSMGFYNVPLNQTVLTEANRDLIPYMYSCLIKCSILRGSVVCCPVLCYILPRVLWRFLG